MRQPTRFVLGTPPAGPPAWDYLRRQVKKYKREREEGIKNDSEEKLND
jgi:hypothetical protein